MPQLVTEQLHSIMRIHLLTLCLDPARSQICNYIHGAEASRILLTSDAKITS
jgi:hypothetical protein